MKVLCAGLTVCDLIFRPMSREVLEQDTSKAEDIKLSGGGDAYNVAMNLAALGEKVELLTKIGLDDLGEYLFQKLKKAEIGVKWCKRVEIPTSASGVFIKEDGERSFLSYKGACHSLNKVYFVQEIFNDKKYLYLGSAFDLPQLDGAGMVEVFENAQAAGVKTILDTTGEPKIKDMEWFSEVLKHTDYFLPSLREAQKLTGKAKAEEAAEQFAELGVGCIVIKLGAQGCLLYEKGKFTKISAYPASVVDTTGAGDAFVAGFISGLLQGFSFEKCAQYGNVIGSLAVEKLGASGHEYKKEEIERRLQYVAGFTLSKD